MAFELWQLNPPWRKGAAKLLERINDAKNGSLPEGLPMPIEVEVIEHLPELIDSALNDFSEKGSQLMDSILLAIGKQGVWLDPEGRWAVTVVGSRS